MSLILAASESRRVLVTTQSERDHARDLVEAFDGRPGQLFAGAAHERQLPAELAQVIGRVVEAMASGATITIGSLPDELSTTLAAEQLGVSRPTLMKMIREGQIPSHKVGSHHRLRSADVLSARRARLEQQRRAFDELRALEDELSDGGTGVND